MSFVLIHFEFRSMRKSRNKSTRTPGPELPLPQISTLRSRKRLANILVASSIIFVGCWTPYIICVLCFELKTTATYCPKTVSDFSLLLGEFLLLFLKMHYFF